MVEDLTSKAKTAGFTLKTTTGVPAASNILK